MPDYTSFLNGSGLGDGAAGIASTPGRHIKLSEGTPIVILWLTQARMRGVEMARCAGLTGEIESLKRS